MIKKAEKRRTSIAFVVFRRPFCSACGTGVARGGLRGLAPQRMRKNIKASLVNLTLNIRYKMAKKYPLSSSDTFFQAQNALKSVFGHWGSLQRSPRSPSRPPHAPPHSSPSASRTRRLLGSQAPLNTKSWLRHWRADKTQWFFGLPDVPVPRPVNRKTLASFSIPLHCTRATVVGSSPSSCSLRVTRLRNGDCHRT